MSGDLDGLAPNSPPLVAIHPTLSPAPGSPVELTLSEVRSRQLGNNEGAGTGDIEIENQEEHIENMDNDHESNNSTDADVAKISVSYFELQYRDSASPRAVADDLKPPESAISTSSFLLLPKEVQVLIAMLLDPEDAFNMAILCKSLVFLLNTPQLGSILRQTRPFACEVLAASTSSVRALRTYVKRRVAVQSGLPFAVACIENVFDFMYSNGVVCYTISETNLQFLNLNQSDTFAKPSSIPALAYLQNFRNPNMSQHHKYYAHGYISYTHSWMDTTTHRRVRRLIVHNQSNKEFITCREIPTDGDVCIRNSKDWLYCCCAVQEDRYTWQWRLHEFNFYTKQWSRNIIPLIHMPYGRIGISNCFEISNGFLYGASSEVLLTNLQDSFYRMPDSFYYIFRFPLGEPTQSQVMDKMDCMRRQITNNVVVDDRWSSLNLSTDEAKGDIYLYETRREDSQSSSHRDCHRIKLAFRKPPNGFPGANTETEGWQPDWGNLDNDERTHNGDKWDKNGDITFAPLNTYIPSCRTFLDIALTRGEDSADVDMMQIRARSLCMRNISEREQRRLQNGVFTWPSKQRETENLLCKVLRPVRELQYYADDRYLVFSEPRTTWLRRRDVSIFAFDPSCRIAAVE